MGIPREMLERVFEMFTQAHQSQSTDGGLGIGLSIVRRLVELHHGRVTADSPGPGCGSIFRVWLPVLARGPVLDKESAPVIPLEAQPRQRILIVDDNRDAARMLGMLLSASGHQTETAHDGEEALVKAGEFRPEVILLDLGLPKMSGYDVCRAIRRESWGADVTIIALTGWGQAEDRRKSASAGFDCHLVKPVDHAALNAAMARATSGKTVGNR
jgi:CheY-like chemotaxis protein